MEINFADNTLEQALHSLNRHQIRAADIPTLLDKIEQVKVLSLDCFDTLLWRQTAAPKDIFFAMQERPLWKSLNINAHQRIHAAARAYRLKMISEGSKEITLKEIYQQFTALSADQQQALVQEEILAEIELCYAFPIFLHLIRQAKAKNIEIIIVSNTYLQEPQLKQLLAAHLAPDLLSAISKIFCSCEAGCSKSEGLFEYVLSTLNRPAHEIVHIGDHQDADYVSPQSSGIRALHFVQFSSELSSFLRIQDASSSLAVLRTPSPNHLHLRSARYSPFRGIFSLGDFTQIPPETLIGYLSFGPILYAFAYFIQNEIELLKQQGKKTKVFFLLRDAHLLAQACEAFSGRSVGKSVHIRKFGAVAASFRSKEDVDHYLLSLAPHYYDFWVICAQLLLPHEITVRIIQQANASLHPEKKFNELIHQPNILELVFKQSAAYRERLLHYIRNELGLESGDTVVLVDVGYVGVTQDFLTRTLKNIINVNITGRYLIASHDPFRPDSKALITTNACDHGLFEQSCTMQEGAVIDYTEYGQPVFEKIKLSNAQYQRVQAIQDECLRFIHDAKNFFAMISTKPSLEIFQQTAIAALKRHVYLPQEAELRYYDIFQHDKDMGPTSNKTMFNINTGLAALRQGHSPFRMHPYESRAESLHFALSAMMQRVFELEFEPEDISFRHELIKIINVHHDAATETLLQATPTHDGFFSVCAPAMNNAQLSIMFGQNYQWVQITAINLLNPGITHFKHLNDQIVLEHLCNRGGDLYQCESKSSALTIKPIIGASEHLIYHILFRPIEKW